MRRSEPVEPLLRAIPDVPTWLDSSYDISNEGLFCSLCGCYVTKSLVTTHEARCWPSERNP